jgi:hypothetical protein
MLLILGLFVVRLWIDKPFLYYFVWRICVDGRMQLSQCKGIHQNTEEIRQGAYCSLLN